MPRLRLLAVLPLALALVSCSKTTTTAPSGGNADARGTPLTGENAFETGTRLTWSPFTNEVLGSAQSGGSLGGPGLVAVRTIDGAVRVLDPVPVLFPLVGPNGQQVFYDAITADSTVLRERSLGTGGAVTRLAALPGLAAFTFVLSGDGLYLAYAGSGVEPREPDTLRVLNLSNGQRPVYSPASPIAFSPEDGTLLVAPAGGGWATLALPSGDTTRVDFVLPGGAGMGGIHWDEAGIHALFTLNGDELWESTVAGSGGQPHVFTANEPIVAPSITWSPDGTRAAFWTVGPIDGGADTAYRLYVVAVTAQAGGVVAVGRATGGAIAWSPDGTRLAYLFGGRLFTVSVVAAGAAPSAR